MARRFGRARKFFFLGLWLLWVLYLGAFVAVQIERHDAPPGQEESLPFGSRQGFSAEPPRPVESLALFVLLGIIIPGAIYVAPRLVGRWKGRLRARSPRARHPMPGGRGRVRRRPRQKS